MENPIYNAIFSLRKILLIGAKLAFAYGVNSTSFTSVINQVGLLLRRCVRQISLVCDGGDEAR